jgi:hypothetical protein
MYTKLDVGFQYPDQLTVHFECGSYSASCQGSPGSGISACLRDCAQFQSPVVAAAPPVADTAPPAFCQAPAVVCFLASTAPKAR